MGPLPWTAHVLRTADGFRSLFLCAAGPSPETAMSELLVKSADAARSYIGFNGYALPPSSNAGPQKGHDGGNPSLSDSSLTVDVLENDLSTSSGCESLSDDETVSVATAAGAKKPKHKSGKERKRKEAGKGSNARPSRSRSRSRTTARSASRSRSRSCSSSGSSGIIEDEQNPPRVWMPLQGPSGFVSHPGGPGNPPPPPGYTSWPPHMQGMPRMARNPLPQASVPPQLPPMTPHTNTTRSAATLHDVLIRIHWIGRGYAQVMKRLVANQPSLRSTALTYVRRNPDAFGGGVQASDYHALKLPAGSQGGLCLLANLRSVSVAGEQVDLRHYQGDSLGALLIHEANGSSRGALPRFEIDVSVSPPPPPPPSHYLRQPEKGPVRPVSGGQAAGDS